MSFKPLDCVLLFVLIVPILADYGMDDMKNYRFDTDLSRFPVRSPDELFGFEVPADYNPVITTIANNPYNQINQNHNAFNDFMDQNNVIADKPSIQTPKKKIHKNRVKTQKVKQLNFQPLKLVFSQYMSRPVLQSEDSYPLSPTETLSDQSLSGLIPQIMATAEQLVLEKESEDMIGQYSRVIPASAITSLFRSSEFFHLTDSPYGLKRLTRVRSN